jgi:hypothetical protein
MDAIASAVRVPVWLLFVSLSVFLTMPQGDCLGGNPSECQAKHQPFFDGSVLAAWSRTWHAPTPWATPLAPYYIPRTPACAYGGEFAGYARECSAGIDKYTMPMEAADYESRHYHGALRANGENCGVEGGFERIGHIPNELGIAGALPPGAPAAPPR